MPWRSSPCWSAARASRPRAIRSRSASGAVRWPIASTRRASRPSVEPVPDDEDSIEEVMRLRTYDTTAGAPPCATVRRRGPYHYGDASWVAPPLLSIPGLRRARWRFARAGLCSASMGNDAAPDRSPARVVEPIAEMALGCVHREYPSHVSHTLRGDEDARPPRRLTPAFYGSFDWHSAVHGHWCLARLVRLHPTAEFAPRAEAALDESLTPEKLAGEVAYLSVPGREGFERPYGLAWLLQLAAELREWGSGRAWLEALVPLEALAAARLAGWLPRLRWPIRSGEHGQSAFAMALALDWARVAGDRGLESLLRSRALDFYGADSDAPLAFEPSGHDFLSPILGEADLMRRVLPPREFAGWLARLRADLESR